MYMRTNNYFSNTIASATMKLTTQEEKIMLIIWRLGKATTREIHENFSEPKPNMTTVATFLNQLGKKKIVSSVQVSRSYVFTPNISFDDYKKSKVEQLLFTFFDGDKKALKDLIESI